jgi:7 transmembrane sweet-taste receptor of 3 GCPR/Bacterial extracellular solute-binding protein
MDSPLGWNSKLGREMQERTENDSCCSSSECAEVFTAGRSPITRIAVSSSDARSIELYLANYTTYLENKGDKASTIQLSQLPSIEELYKDIRHDLKSRSGLYDGFIIPPILMGDLLALEGVATLSSSESDGAVGGMTQLWNDLLPYYKKQIATLDGHIYGMPLLGGNMPLLLYRKDYLEAFDLSVPVTWGEYIRVASTLHNQTLAPDATGIFGSCMGRMSQAMCRRQMNVEAGRNCVSMSMTYIGMMVASMTQNRGSSSGWLFDSKQTGEMIPLLDPALESVLVFMEQQLKYGAPDELVSDSSMNLELFREGKCAMTISLDHPTDLLDRPEVGFAAVPGAHIFLDRESISLVACTKESCPYGEPNDEWGIVNQAPFGSDHMMVGSVSSYASNNARDEIYEFFSYIAEQRGRLNLTGDREQPTTYSSLEESTVDGYASVIRALTESNNTVAPLRIPYSFSLLSELDNQVYDYLSAGNFSNDTRRRVRQRVEASLQRMIRQYDTINRLNPISVSYEKSLNVYSPVKSPDLYIGRTERLIGWSLGGIGCFCSIFFAFWVWRNKESSVVRGSQELFLNLLCLGTFLMACCIFLFGVDDQVSSTEFASRACMGSTWLYSLGYIIMVSALSSKILLINRVSHFWAC